MTQANPFAEVEAAAFAILAAHLLSAAITAGLGAYVAGLMFRNFGSPKI